MKQLILHNKNKQYNNLQIWSFFIITSTCKMETCNFKRLISKNGNTADTTSACGLQNNVGVSRSAEQSATFRHTRPDTFRNYKSASRPNDLSLLGAVMKKQNSFSLLFEMSLAFSELPCLGTPSSSFHFPAAADTGSL